MRLRDADPLAACARGRKICFPLRLVLRHGQGRRRRSLAEQADIFRRGNFHRRPAGAGPTQNRIIPLAAAGHRERGDDEVLATVDFKQGAAALRILPLLVAAVMNTSRLPVIRKSAPTEEPKG